VQVDKFDKQSSLCYIMMKENPMTQIFKDKVEVLKSTMPVVGNLRDESKTMQHRHWLEVYETIGIELTLDDDLFTL
jgi:hypothetical protein